MDPAEPPAGCQKRGDYGGRFFFVATCRLSEFVEISIPTTRRCGLFERCRARRRRSRKGPFRACSLIAPRGIAFVEYRSSWRPWSAQVSVAAARGAFLTQPHLVLAARRSISNQS